MNQEFITRRLTSVAKVATLDIGGESPISVQSMTNVPTHDIERCVRQISDLVNAGCELVRVAAATPADTAALAEIVRQSPVPIVADVHFHYLRALEAIRSGVAKIRLNPGNISDRSQVEQVISACKANGVAIRVGVNEGSVVERRNKNQRAAEQKQDMVDLMVAKLCEYVRIFEDHGFDNLVLSAKCHDGARCIAVNRRISLEFDYPLHLGLTHAGDIQTGTIRSAATLGTLLAAGIGDTIRISLAGDPLVEVETAWELLNTLGLRPRRGPELIACPTCGRTEIDLLSMVAKVRVALSEIDKPIKVAVMGCVVNGPGEADGADVALCGGKDKAVIYRQGQKVATVAGEAAVDKLLEQVRLFLNEQP